MNIFVCRKYILTKCSPSTNVLNVDMTEFADNSLSMHFKDLHKYKIVLYTTQSNRKIISKNISKGVW